MSCIEVTDLTITANSAQQVVRGVSFQVDAGEKVGIIGESGSGKSVTTLALLGLLPRQLRAEGSVVVDGTQVIAAAERTLQRLRGAAVTMVLQDPSTALDPLARVERLIAEPIRRHRNLRGSALAGAVRAAGPLLRQRTRR